MPYTYRDLLSMADIYDGRSCDVDGDLGDSITAQRDDGSITDSGGRVDQNGTFQDINQCCIVQKCVFGQTPSACAGIDLLCPSQRGYINPRTCQKESPKLDDDGEELDDAHRQGYYRTQEDCCYSKVILDGCTARSPDHTMKKWENLCCPYNDDSYTVLSSGTPRDNEDFLIT